MPSLRDELHVPTPTQARRAARGRCPTPRCPNPRGKHSRFCPRCLSRRFKAAHPLKYAYNLLRCGAKRRGHAFELSFEDYERWGHEHGYHEGKGRGPMDLTIDRKDARIGYRLDNIICTTNLENATRQDRPWFAAFAFYGATLNEARERTEDAGTEPEEDELDPRLGASPGADEPF